MSLCDNTWMALSHDGQYTNPQSLMSKRDNCNPRGRACDKKSRDFISWHPYRLSVVKFENELNSELMSFRFSHLYTTSSEIFGKIAASSSRGNSVFRERMIISQYKVIDAILAFFFLLLRATLHRFLRSHILSWIIVVSRMSELVIVQYDARLLVDEWQVHLLYWNGGFAFTTNRADDDSSSPSIVDPSSPSIADSSFPFFTVYVSLNVSNCYIKWGDSLCYFRLEDNGRGK